MKHHPMIHSKLYRFIELVVLMIGIPLALYFYVPKGALFAILWLTALYANVIYRSEVPKEQRWGWNRSAVTWQAMKPTLLRFAISALVLTIATWVFRPDLLFSFVRERPQLWMLVMVFYPILSAAPQEIIFREFFFARYATYFTSTQRMVLASGIAFAFAHIFFHNWVAPLLCLIGGVMFAQTYARHRSLLVVTIEHALYGCFIFTLGLGRFFYHGAIH